ncbi:MAG: DNA polymerase/3'-5' exonuclease PolX [Candidatus Pacebacteria bacterium]|nr:DNA polymerase/3'-5' exonuclease PolX [Candidatus Paceibacterota bacterium]
MTNKEVARLLRAMAAAYEIKKESRFRIAAYERAASVIEQAGGEVKDFWDEDRLKDLPGVGENIANYLDELFRTGRVKHFQKVIKGLPPAMFSLLEVPGIGPQTAWKLCENLGIRAAKNAFSRLEKAAREGKIRLIPGFGPDSEKKILRGLLEFRRRPGRILLSRALIVAEKLIDFLKEEKSIIRVDPLGSLRRMTATVGDIDLGVSTRNSRKALTHAERYPEIARVLAAGKNILRIKLKNGLQVDIKTQKPESYGAMLQHFTGSKQHNIHLREIALKKGLSLSEYGIKRFKSQNTKYKNRAGGLGFYKFATEKDFYSFLGMQWIPPELREDSGEIEAVLCQNQRKLCRLPKLVKAGDLRGDLHLHSRFPVEPSHDLGAASMEEMIRQAKKMGYQYLAFTEHNPSLSRHNPIQILSILKRKREIIDKINYSSKKSERKFWVFNSLEIDIRPDGRLALPKEGLATLDFAIAAIHSSFRLGRKEMTQRIIRALSEKKVKILAHPAGRMIGRREAYEVDWELIFAYCLKNKKALEINSCPQRLDLPDFLVRQAVKAGVKMVISSDAHSLEEMKMIKYGIAVARRGWSQKETILNTLKYDKISQWLINKA